MKFRFAEIDTNDMTEAINYALTSPEILRAFKEYMADFVTEKAEAYKKEASAYNDIIEKEVRARAARLSALKTEKAAIEAQLTDAESLLGNALVTGDNAAEKDAEATIAAIRTKIEEVDRKIDIFNYSAVGIGDKEKLAKLRALNNELQGALADATTVINAYYEAFYKNREAMEAAYLYKWKSGHPASARSTFASYIQIPRSCSIDRLEEIAKGVSFGDLQSRG